VSGAANPDCRDRGQQRERTGYRQHAATGLARDASAGPGERRLAQSGSGEAFQERVR
jgi:hypothetical protein